MNNTPGLDLIKRAQRDLLADPKCVFWGLLFDHLILAGESPQVQTAATDGKHLWWNTPYLETLNREECKGLLIHEIGHCATLQIPRAKRIAARHGYDHPTLNRAMDYALNDLLRNSGVILPEGGLWEPRFAGMPFERIARVLWDEQGQKPQEQPKQPLKVDGACILGEEGDPNSDKPASGQPKPDTEQQDAQEWQAAIVRAGRAAGSQTCETLVTTLLRTQPTPIAWQDLLHRYVRDRIEKQDYSYARANRRMLDTHRVYMPTLYTPQADAFCVLVDISGSIDCTQANAFISSLEEIRLEFPAVPIRWITFDTRICSDTTIEPGDPLPPIRSGGGTDIACPFKYLAAENADLVVCLCFTDLEDYDFTRSRSLTPDQHPPYPVIFLDWACTQPPAPFGDTIRVKGGRDAC